MTQMTLQHQNSTQPNSRERCISNLPSCHMRCGRTIDFTAHQPMVFILGLLTWVSLSSFDVQFRFLFLPMEISTQLFFQSFQYICEVIRSLEEAGKVIEPVQASATERLSLSGGGRLRDLQDPNSRRGRILASMCILRDPVADTRERSSEPFEPSEESITTFAEMGFGRDHALEALETVATNRVEVAMEYALTHPPSSPREDWNINNDIMTLSVNLYNRGKSVQARMAWMTHHPIQMELRISPQTQTHPLPTR